MSKGSKDEAVEQPSRDMVWLDLPGGNRRKDKHELEALIEAGFVKHDEDTVETYRMTDAGRRAYITGVLTDDKDQPL